jgi:integrase
LARGKLKDFKATDADRFLKDLGKVLGKRSLMMIKSTLRRSIRRAQVQDLIGKNVVELIDLPTGQPGRQSRAMTEEEAGKVPRTAANHRSPFVKVVRLKGRYDATHAAREDGALVCGNRPRTDTPVTEMGVELAQVTCRACRSQLGVGENTDVTDRLAALFVLSITLGLRPGELRRLGWVPDGEVQVR